MEHRAFILDKFNTWHDWRLTLTGKTIEPAEPKTNYIDIEGAHGSLDFSEALAGEPVYGDSSVAASFMCSEGDHREREALLRQIRTALHGRRLAIVEPDDPEHYFLGRVSIKEAANHLAYMELSIEATCDPWRYALEETVRFVPVSGSSSVVINNHGDKTVCPVLTVTGNVSLKANGVATSLSAGTYKITDLRLAHGANVVEVSGAGSIAFTYREAAL